MVELTRNHPHEIWQQISTSQDALSEFLSPNNDCLKLWTYDKAKLVIIGQINSVDILW